MQDLLLVELINRQLNDRLPVTYNHYLQGGYLNMPSARMGDEGEIGFGYSSVPPYRNYNLRCQVYNNIELTGSYRIFCGILDPVLGSSGFGDFSDKGVNVKVAVLRPEDSDYSLPGFAFGFDDFLGTRSFKSAYLVATQVVKKADLEFSIGFGKQRINRWFGGALWMPFRHECNPYLHNIAFTLEYDATDYKNDPHPKGRHRKTPFNAGIKYRLWDCIDLSAACMKGSEFAWSASTYYNFGYTNGFLPKMDDVLPYCSPVNTEPLGELRSEDILAQDLIYPFRAQGFEVLSLWLSYDACNRKVLRIRILNCIYRYEGDVRDRLNHLLAALMPSDIDEVYVSLESEGFPIQEYRFHMAFVHEYLDRRMGDNELNLLAPRCEVSYPDPCTSQLLFKQNRDFFYWDILPKTQTYFGSSSGKFKYAIGVNTGFHGYFPQDIYYQMLFGYTFFSELDQVKDMDRLNPSQLINVKTDLVNYYRRTGFTIDKFYLQKTWNMGKGFYSRFGGGHFDIAYGGLTGEVLYYPANGCWAVGVEGSLLRKRKLDGLGFTDKIRKLDGFTPTYVKFNGSQYFLDLYYDWKFAQLDFKFSVGKFLANDFGMRYEITRYFESGLRISFWYTGTDAHDVVNGRVYHDKGIAFSMPLDIFYMECARDRWGYGMSAWLRDCGYRAPTGRRLYELIFDQRQN